MTLRTRVSSTAPYPDHHLHSVKDAADPRRLLEPPSAPNAEPSTNGHDAGKGQSQDNDEEQQVDSSWPTYPAAESGADAVPDVFQVTIKLPHEPHSTTTMVGRPPATRTSDWR